jgi:hypothetical protein
MANVYRQYSNKERRELEAWWAEVKRQYWLTHDRPVKWEPVKRKKRLLQN